MHSSPGRYHCGSRLTATVSSLMSSHVWSSPTRSRGAEIDDGEPGLLPHGRMPAIGADDQIGIDLEHAVRGAGDETGDARAVVDEIRDLGLHAQPERRIALGVADQKIEEIPLRHEGNELAARRQVGEIRDRERRVADLAFEFAGFVMGAPEKILEQAELVHQLEGRGMDRIAAEIAEEVGVLLEDEDADAGARQKEAQHHAGRAAARDGAADLHGFGGSCSVRAIIHGDHLSRWTLPRLLCLGLQAASVFASVNFPLDAEAIVRNQ